MFVIDTDPASAHFGDAAKELIEQINADIGDTRVHFVDPSPASTTVTTVTASKPRTRKLSGNGPPAPGPAHKNAFYGYDATDQMLELMLAVPDCEWIMFTNGDNV